MARDARFSGFSRGTYKAGNGLGFAAEGSEYGEPCAYIALREETAELTVIEVGCPQRKCRAPLLAALAGLAGERGCNGITLEIPADDPFADFRTGCGCVVEARYPRMPDGMLRVLDTPTLAQFVTGYRSAVSLIGPGEAADTLDTLFAAAVPCVWQADRF